jgi:hypothetical protein
MSRDEIEKSWAARVLVVKSGLLAFSDRLPPILVGKPQKEIAAIIRSEVIELLNAYATKGKYIPEIKT